MNDLCKSTHLVNAPRTFEILGVITSSTVCVFFFHYTSLKRYPPSKKTLDSILSYLEAIHFSIPMVSSSKKENIQNDLIENKSRTQLSDSTELKH